MTDQRHLGADPTVPASRPIPDLGYFAEPGGTQSSPFGAQPPLGAPSQLGAPSPFGGPVSHPAQAPNGRQSRSPWLVVAAAGALLGLLGLVVGGRFAWHQFVADPVLPDTLMGMPRIQGMDVDAQLATMSAELRSDLSAGSEAEVAMYTDGLGTGYIVMAIRGSSRPGSDSEDSDLSGWTESEHDGVSCASSPAQDGTGLGATLCIRGFFRRAVAVLALGQLPPDPGTVARATNDAWDAQ